jgi:hypothetical protein
VMVKILLRASLIVAPAARAAARVVGPTYFFFAGSQWERESRSCARLRPAPDEAKRPLPSLSPSCKFLAGVTPIIILALSNSNTSLSRSVVLA